jgi:hypothetical protein
MAFPVPVLIGTIVFGILAFLASIFGLYCVRPRLGKDNAQCVSETLARAALSRRVSASRGLLPTANITIATALART